MASASPTETLSKTIWPFATDMSSAVLAGVPLSSTIATSALAMVVLPVLVTL